MSNLKLLERYSALNTAKSRKLVFHLTKRGFASELNSLVLAVLYCLQNDIEFNLDSHQWSGKHDKGWTDYFEPFCPEQHISLPAPIRAMRRPREDEMSYRQHHHPNTLFITDIWRSMRRKDFLANHFSIPELGIDGDIFHAKHQLLKLIYRPNEQVCNLITQYAELPARFSPYVAVHIRRGDKVAGAHKEANAIAVSHYTRAVRKRGRRVKNVYIASDDYDAADEFVRFSPTKWRIALRCTESSKGYDNVAFAIQDPQTTKTQMYDLLIDLHLLAEAEVFIGTYSSNIGRLLVLLRNNYQCHSLDRKWRA
jgi:hypothetical protein